jgi:predicted RNA-binding protein with PUA-like domain
MGTQNVIRRNMTNRTEASRQFLRKLSQRQSGIGFLDRIITTDETGFHYYDPETKQQSSQWKNVDSPWPKKAKVTKSLGKNMFILFMDRKGMILTLCSFPLHQILLTGNEV